MTWVEQKLRQLESKGIRRALPPIEGGGLCFASNDYLDLSCNELVKQASIDATIRFGCSGRSSRLLQQVCDLYEQLEQALSCFLGYEKILLFGSGYLANFGVFNAITQRNDCIFEDRLNHASLIDATRNTPAKVYRYTHNDPRDLEKKLQQTPCSGNRLIVTDSLFSMDGDIAPLKDLERIAKKYQALLIVDEAHAIGPFSGGLCQRAGIKPDIITGTLSKALCSYGGFAATSEPLYQLMLSLSRTGIFSTALPPACAAAALQALKIITSSPKMAAPLLENAQYFHTLLGSDRIAQIVPVIVTGNARAQELSALLKEEGIHVPAIRPPTVPEHTARLRFSLRLSHTKEDLTRVAQLLKEHL